MNAERILRDGKGAVITLGPVIARGGEGTIYETGSDQLAAKIYHQEIDAGKAAKLRALSRFADRLPDCAMPRDLILDDLRPVGFTMHRFSGGKELHHLTATSSRRRWLPDAGWNFLVHAAVNLSAVIDQIHSCRLIIGDINCRGFLVSRDARIKVIDCDSFQVQDGATIHRCTVGFGDYTPPELQDVDSLRDVLRTENHDAFGLAVLIFQLLFLDNHPYIGIPVSGNYDSMTISEVIARFRYAYASDAAARGVRPPYPYAPALAMLPSSVAAMFEAAFTEAGVTGRRPSAIEWHQRLSELERRLGMCRENPSHWFSRDLPSCPWCAYRALNQVECFAVVVAQALQAVALRMGRSAEQILQALSDIALIDAQMLTRTMSGIATPSISQWTLAWKRICDGAHRVLVKACIVSALIFPVGCFTSVVSRSSGKVAGGVIMGAAVITIVLAVLLSMLLNPQGNARRWAASMRRRQSSLDQVLRSSDLELCAWEAGIQDFNARATRANGRFWELRMLFTQHHPGRAPQAMPSPALTDLELKRAIQDYREGKAKAYLQSYLSGFRIRNHVIPYIGPEQVAILTINGVITAADVRTRPLDAWLPGTAISALTAWCDELEGRFSCPVIGAPSPAEMEVIRHRAGSTANDSPGEDLATAAMNRDREEFMLEQAVNDHGDLLAQRNYLVARAQAINSERAHLGDMKASLLADRQILEQMGISTEETPTPLPGPPGSPSSPAQPSQPLSTIGGAIGRYAPTVRHLPWRLMRWKRTSHTSHKKRP